MSEASEKLLQLHDELEEHVKASNAVTVSLQAKIEVAYKAFLAESKAEQARRESLLSELLK